jgi:hypothetical protein
MMCISCQQRPAGTEKSKILCRECEEEMDRTLEVYRRYMRRLAQSTPQVSNR